jgi:hypothetical protein
VHQHGKGEGVERLVGQDEGSVRADLLPCR